MGLIFGIFDIVTETDKETGERKLIYKYTRQEGITVKRVEQLGIESRLINRLFEEQGRDALRYEIIKKAEAVQDDLFRKNKLAEMLVIFEYYYEHVYKLDETEIAGGAKRKVETYQYDIVRKLARNIEEKITDDKRNEFVSLVRKLKKNLESFSELCADGVKRVLKVDFLLGAPASVSASADNEPSKEKIGLEKLKELKSALDLGLITLEEYNAAKDKFLQ
jgi:hypothetical protein